MESELGYLVKNTVIQSVIYQYIPVSYAKIRYENVAIYLLRTQGNLGDIMMNGFYSSLKHVSDTVETVIMRNCVTRRLDFGYSYIEIDEYILQFINSHKTLREYCMKHAPALKGLGGLDWISIRSHQDMYEQLYRCFMRYVSKSEERVAKYETMMCGCDKHTRFTNDYPEMFLICSLDDILQILDWQTLRVLEENSEYFDESQEYYRYGAYRKGKCIALHDSPLDRGNSRLSYIQIKLSELKEKKLHNFYNTDMSIGYHAIPPKSSVTCIYIIDQSALTPDEQQMLIDRYSYDKMSKVKGKYVTTRIIPTLDKAYAKLEKEVARFVRKCKRIRERKLNPYLN